MRKMANGWLAVWESKRCPEKRLTTMGNRAGRGGSDREKEVCVAPAGWREQMVDSLDNGISPPHMI